MEVGEEVGVDEEADWSTIDVDWTVVGVGVVAGVGVGVGVGVD